MTVSTLAQNPIVAALRRENLLPKKIGGLQEEEDETTVEQRQSARRREQLLANFTPLSNMAERIRNLDNFIQQRAAVKPRPAQSTAVAKLVKNFTPQPGFYQKTTPRTEKVRKQMQEELSLALNHGSRTPPPTPVMTSQAPTPVKKYPINRPQPIKAKLPTVVPKIAGIDFMGVPEIKDETQTRYPKRSLLPKRIEELKMTGLSNLKKKLLPTVKDDIFNKARRYSDEDLARQVNAPGAKSPDVCPTAPAITEDREPNVWCWLGRQAADYCKVDANNRAQLPKLFNNWFRGRVQAWTALHDLKDRLGTKCRLLEAHLATLQALNSAMGTTVETDVPNFDYHQWTRIGVSAKSEVAAATQLYEVESRVWLTAIERIIRTLGAQLSKLNNIFANMKKSNLTSEQQAQVIASLVQSDEVNELIAASDIGYIVEAELWILGRGYSALNSQTARLWSEFLSSHKAAATLIKGADANHFSIRRAV